MKATIQNTIFRLTVICMACTLFVACSKPKQDKSAEPQQQAAQTIESPPPQAHMPNPADSYARKHLQDYAQVRLTADLSGYTQKQKKMLVLLIKAADIMNDLFWDQAYGDKTSLLAHVKDAATRKFVLVNYGPWDRLNGDKPFVAGIGAKPLGANFYPQDMTKKEFDQAKLQGKAGLYTFIRRDDNGALETVPYHLAYQTKLAAAAALLKQAASLAADKGFRHYLELRAQALVTDDYRPSDIAWMDMKTNPVDIVIGPIETYEDKLFGYKAAYESFVLLKDQAWSERLARFAKYLPQLQKELPVPHKYKTEKPGTDSDLNAYNAIFYAGDANAGAKTIAINLPNDEKVQLEKGTRRLQLENVMKAKFDEIMVPIANELIARDQLRNVTFDAFFQNTMFHEVAHGLGIKNTINHKGTVRKALREYASSFEEGKADVLGLYIITRLAEKGELDKTKLMDNYVTFLAGIFRSVRFGATDAHAKANMVRFNFFLKRGAFTRDQATGRYRVNFDKMQEAMNALTSKILEIQGNGNYATAKKMTAEMGVIGPQLQADLDRLNKNHIPVDVRFIQGLDVLGLTEPPVAVDSAAAVNPQP